MADDEDYKGLDAKHIEHSDLASQDVFLRDAAPEGPYPISPTDRAAFERKLVLRLDLRLMPIIILIFIMNYIDVRVCPREGVSVEYLVLIIWILAIAYSRVSRPSSRAGARS